MSDAQADATPITAAELVVGMVAHVHHAASMLQEIAVAMLQERPREQMEYAAGVAFAKVAYLNALIAEAIRDGHIPPDSVAHLRRHGFPADDLDAVLAAGARAHDIIEAHNEGALIVTEIGRDFIKSADA